MLFDKDTPKICAYCLFAQDYDDTMVLCSKKGPVQQTDHCRKYIYDPIRRKPVTGAVLKPVEDENAFRL